MESSENLDTRGYLNQLIDYEMIYPGNPLPGLEDAAVLIKGVPSLTLLLQLGSINMSLYLNDSSEAGLKMQTDLVKAHFLFKTPSSQTYQSELSVKVVEAFRQIQNDGQWPFLFYRLSNLVFYDLIFQHYDHAPIRDLTNEERERFLKAYLIVNSTINARIKIDVDSFNEALKKNEREKILLPKFIYQKDFVSNSDFSNQLVRSFYFFDYLENHPDYGKYIKEYYSSISVNNRYDLINKLVVVFMSTFRAASGPNCLFTLSTEAPEEDKSFMNGLSFLLPDISYQSDIDFTEFRKRMFVSRHTGKHLLLDIGFFIDQFYKAQVFAVNQFLKTKGINDFLKNKGEEFMENIYMPLVLEACFPLGQVTKPAAELGDFHITDSGKLAIVELKDSIMSSKSKNSGDPDTFFSDLDQKFVQSGKGQKKGISQLAPSIKKIFDQANPTKAVYPIILYTDNAHGYDGLNKNYIQQFNDLIESNYRGKTKSITFINISFFEHAMNHLQRGEINLFDLIDGYHVHIAAPQFDTTPFEVFAMTYLRKQLKKPAETSTMFDNVLHEVRTKALGF